MKRFQMDEVKLADFGYVWTILLFDEGLSPHQVAFPDGWRPLTFRYTIEVYDSLSSDVRSREFGGERDDAQVAARAWLAEVVEDIKMVVR